MAALPVTVRVDEGRGAGGLLGAGEVGAPPGELHPVLLHGEALLRRVPPDLPGTSILIQHSTVQLDGTVPADLSGTSTLTASLCWENYLNCGVKLGSKNRLQQRGDNGGVVCSIPPPTSIGQYKGFIKLSTG